MQRSQHPPTFFSTEYCSQATTLSAPFLIPTTDGLATRRCCEVGLALLSFHEVGLYIRDPRKLSHWAVASPEQQRLSSLLNAPVG